MNQLGFISSYSPIHDNGMGINSAGVPYYGMLAFVTATTGSAEILPFDFDPQGINLTSYACGSGRDLRALVVINRDKLQDVDLSLAQLGMGEVAAYRLLSPSPDSASSVTFGNSSVDSEGRWAPGSPEYIGGARVIVPHMSAAVLLSRHKREQ